MIEIANNDFYELNVNTVTNRLYIKAKGFWEEEIAEQYSQHTSDALLYLTDKFTILSDVTELTTQSQTVQTMIEQWQKMVKKSGLLTAASVVPKDFVTKFQLDSMSKRTKIPKGVFIDFSEADKWLDKQIEV